MNGNACRRVDACLEKDLFCQSFIHSDGAAERIGTCVADTEQVKSSLKFSVFLHRREVREMWYLPDDIIQWRLVQKQSDWSGRDAFTAARSGSSQLMFFAISRPWPGRVNTSSKCSGACSSPKIRQEEKRHDLFRLMYGRCRRQKQEKRLFQCLVLRRVRWFS